MTLINDRVSAATHSVRHQFDDKIDTAVVLGSGLSELKLDDYRELLRIDYADINGLPCSTAPSHAGLLRIVECGHRTIALCGGRHHLYEGYSASEVAILIYVLRQLGATTLVITNAAGALNPEYQPGDVMLIHDHINFTGHNPLIGQDDSLGTRFPDMSQAYSPTLHQRAIDLATKQAVSCHSGVYIGVTGPSLETSAERRLFRTLGADAIGMSTVTEVIAANHCGIDVLGISAITNLALGDDHQKPDTIEDVLENAAVAGKSIEILLNELMR